LHRAHFGGFEAHSGRPSSQCAWAGATCNRPYVEEKDADKAKGTATPCPFTLSKSAVHPNRKRLRSTIAKRRSRARHSWNLQNSENPALNPSGHALVWSKLRAEEPFYRAITTRPAKPFGGCVSELLVERSSCGGKCPAPKRNVADRANRGTKGRRVSWGTNRDSVYRQTATATLVLLAGAARTRVVPPNFALDPIRCTGAQSPLASHHSPASAFVSPAVGSVAVSDWRNSGRLHDRVTLFSPSTR
jgi:hypothetical protein